MKGKWDGSSSSSSNGVAKWFWFFYTKFCWNHLAVAKALHAATFQVSLSTSPSLLFCWHSFLPWIVVAMTSSHPTPTFPSSFPSHCLPNFAPSHKTQTAKPEWRRIKICHSWQQPISTNLEEPHQPTFSHTINQLLRKLPDWREPKTPILLLLLLLFSPLRSLSFGIIQKLVPFQYSFEIADSVQICWKQAEYSFLQDLITIPPVVAWLTQELQSRAEGKTVEVRGELLGLGTRVLCVAVIVVPGVRFWSPKKCIVLLLWRWVGSSGLLRFPAAAAATTTTTSKLLNLLRCCSTSWELLLLLELLLYHKLLLLQSQSVFTRWVHSQKTLHRFSLGFAEKKRATETETERFSSCVKRELPFVGVKYSTSDLK